MEINISEIVWEPTIYPRSKWNTETIKRYTEAVESGAEFPPLVIEKGTNRLLDGKHRLEAFKSAELESVKVNVRAVPKGQTAKYFAATLSSSHGDRMSDADLKALAIEEFEANPSLKQKDWGKSLGVSEATVSSWVSHITTKALRQRQCKAFRLSRLGYTQKEIGERLGVARETILAELKEQLSIAPEPAF